MVHLRCATHLCVINHVRYDALHCGACQPERCFVPYLALLWTETLPRCRIMRVQAIWRVIKVANIFR